MKLTDSRLILVEAEVDNIPVGSDKIRAHLHFNKGELRFTGFTSEQSMLDLVGALLLHFPETTQEEPPTPLEEAQPTPPIQEQPELTFLAPAPAPVLIDPTSSEEPDPTLYTSPVVPTGIKAPSPEIITELVQEAKKVNTPKVLVGEPQVTVTTGVLLTPAPLVLGNAPSEVKLPPPPQAQVIQEILEKPLPTPPVENEVHNGLTYPPRFFTDKMTLRDRICLLYKFGYNSPDEIKTHLLHAKDKLKAPIRLETIDNAIQNALASMEAKK